MQSTQVPWKPYYRHQNCTNRTTDSRDMPHSLPWNIDLSLRGCNNIPPIHMYTTIRVIIMISLYPVLSNELLFFMSFCDRASQLPVSYILPWSAPSITANISGGQGYIQIPWTKTLRVQCSSSTLANIYLHYTALQKNINAHMNFD